MKAYSEDLRERVIRAVAVKTAGLQAALPERLAGHADATLADHCSWWQDVSGWRVSTATMSRALTRLGRTRKKRR
jgi:transposase